jgi:hypothetical protein
MFMPKFSSLFFTQTDLAKFLTFPKHFKNFQKKFPNLSQQFPFCTSKACSCKISALQLLPRWTWLNIWLFFQKILEFFRKFSSDFLKISNLSKQFNVWTMFELNVWALASSLDFFLKYFQGNFRNFKKILERISKNCKSDEAVLILNK